jgi:hypothetical protein
MSRIDEIQTLDFRPTYRRQALVIRLTPPPLPPPRGGRVKEGVVIACLIRFYLVSYFYGMV